MNRIYGIGTDIVSIDRIRASLERFGEAFARRVLTQAELTDYQTSRQPERFIAKRFAAKEATVKALGLGFRGALTLNLIGVSHNQYGKPELIFQGRALEQVQAMGVTESLLSIADEQAYAVAFVIVLRT